MEKFKINTSIKSNITNKSTGYKNIYPSGNRFKVVIIRNGKTIVKEYVDTLEEALEKRNKYYAENNEKNIVEIKRAKDAPPRDSSEIVSKYFKVGDLVGEWEIIGKGKNSDYVKCKCSCGKIKEITEYNLISGRTKSCKHGTNQDRRLDLDKDILGKKFGRLSPIKRIENTKISKYLCKCDCGNTVVVSGSRLKSGHTLSCGCLQKDKSSVSMNNIKDLGHKELKKYAYDGTNILQINPDNMKLSKNNKTGVRGVYMTKNGTFVANLCLRGQNKHLGTYKTLEEAKKARKAGEEKYYRPIVDEFYENK